MSPAVSGQDKAVSRARARRGASRPRQAARRASDDATNLARAFELAAFIESASDAVVGVSPAGLITGWGEGAERVFGFSAAEALGNPIAMLAPADRADEPGVLIGRALSGERIERVETERVAKDGRLLNVQLSAAPISGDDGEFIGVVGIFRDLSAQRDAEEALRASERRYQSVIEALNEGVVMQDRDGRLRALNKSAERILGFSAGELPSDLSLIHEDGSLFRGHEHPTMVSIQTGRPQRDIVMGVDGPDLGTRWISINSCPLLRPGESEPYAAAASFTDITEMREMLGELHEARFEDLRRLALMAEYRDDDTNKHTERVARTAALLARELSIESETVATIERAAPLHDVGKVGIPDTILLKPGRLTLEEFEVIKTHTIIGGRILCESRSPVVKMAMEIAFTHHERWDGSGYPSKLREEEIPIAGRIIAVADAFDAMTHARPYKRALSVEHAVAEIERCRGTQFDPHVVDAFMRLDHHSLIDTTCC